MSQGSDTMVSELGAAEDASQTMSVTLSDSLNASRTSTRASTPVEPPDIGASGQPTTPMAEDQAVADDVPMLDLSPDKRKLSLTNDFTSLERTPSPLSEGLCSGSGKRCDSNE